MVLKWPAKWQHLLAVALEEPAIGWRTSRRVLRCTVSAADLPDFLSAIHEAMAAEGGSFAADGLCGQTHHVMPQPGTLDLVVMENGHCLICFDVTVC
jgi:hypothetical protein